MNKIDNGKIGLMVLIATLTLVFFAASAAVTSATTIYVPDDHETIQEAVNAANEGDKVIVRDGTYKENVDVNKPLTIQSENGSVNCIVHASNPKDHVFEMIVNYVSINGFTVTGATGAEKIGIIGIGVKHCNILNNDASTNFCGILLDSSSSNILINNTANSNSLAGIYLYYSSNNTVMNNLANSNNDDGIFLVHSNNNTITNNMLMNNKFGTALSGSCSNMIVNNTATNNRENGIYLLGYSDSNTIKNNNVSNNNYGVFLVSSNNNNIIENIANSNKNNIYGILPSCGISLHRSHNNKITNNTAMNNACGIDLFHSNNNDITNNTASNNDYGIYLASSSDNDVHSNNLIDNGENIFSREDSDIPGFKAVFSIIGLLAVACLLRMRR